MECKVGQFGQLMNTMAMLLAMLGVLTTVLPALSAAQVYSFAASRSVIPSTARTRVEELGLGAKVRLSAGRSAKKLHGYITTIGDDTFELTDVRSSRSYTLAYSDVMDVTGKRLPDPAEPRSTGVLRGLLKLWSKMRMGP